MSRYQLRTLVLRRSIASSAAWLNVTGASPGGHDRHFCVPLKQASMRQSSTRSSCPPSDVTASTSSSAPAACTSREISSSGWCAPVDVSAWTMPTSLARGCAASAASTAAGSMVLPHGTSTSATVAPWRSAMSAMRAPNTPATQMMTSSPGSTRLATHASMPALPVPGTASVSWLRVCITCCSSVRVSSMMRRYAGSRWPSVGAASAASTRAGTVLGPGPINTRSGMSARPAIVDAAQCIRTF